MPPPTTGPSAVARPTVAPNSPKARPRSPRENSCWMSPLLCGVSAPPATPCSSRATTSQPMLGARPASALQAMNAASETTNIRLRPHASPSRPPVTSMSAEVSV